MILKLVLKNFKLFEDSTSIPLSKINLLTGINGRGKSTVLQSLLLMKQSPEFDRTTDKLVLNGHYVKLGNISNVKNVASSLKNPIEFEFHYAYDSLVFKIHYDFIGNSGNSIDAFLERIEILYGEQNNKILIRKSAEGYDVHDDDEISIVPYLFNFFPLTEGTGSPLQIVGSLLNFSRIHYISADRIGPRLYYNKHSLEEFATVGALGENTVNVLFNKRGEKVFENLCIEPDLPRTVFEQANYWFGKIFEGAKIKLDEIQGTDLLSLTFSSNNSTDYFIPTNVGFGFSYVLPIIISGLVARQNEIIIVENPEAHLHPYAQSILSKFLTLVSRNNVQIFIESHSEHILDGFRISIKDRLISANDLKVLYFDKIEERLFREIDVDSDGGISNWPTNFFDQTTKDLNYLLDI